MKYHRPTSLDNLENIKYPIEEYKSLLEERRFLITRFMHVCALYIAIIAYTLKEILTKENFEVNKLVYVFLCVVNFIAIYGALGFRSMIIFTQNREAIIATDIIFKDPIQLFGDSG